MELSEEYYNKLKILEKALSGFSKAINLPDNLLNETQLDTVNSGRIQKFEYSIELLWKTTQYFLNHVIGNDVKGAKPVIREMLSLKLIKENDCNLLLLMIDARNTTSHVYEEEINLKILPLLKDFLPVMIRLFEVMKNFKTNN